MAAKHHVGGTKKHHVGGSKSTEEAIIEAAGYKIEKWLGSGAYGSVAEVADAQDNVWAAKIMHPADYLFDGPNASQVRETATLGELDHPNIVPIHHIFRDVGSRHLVVVMPLADKNLDEAIKEFKKPLSVSKKEQEKDIERRKRYAHEIVCGMEYLWDRGFVHLDLKPANILIDSDDEAVIADFGLSQSRFRDQTAVEKPPNKLVTWWWRAPELQCGLLKYDERADYWSLGLVLLELFFFGVRPFSLVGDDDSKLLEGIGAKLGFPAKFINRVKSEEKHWSSRIREDRETNLPIVAEQLRECILTIEPFETELESLLPPLAVDIVNRLIGPEQAELAEQYYGSSFFLLVSDFIGNLLHVDPDDRILGNISVVFGDFPCPRIIPFTGLVQIPIEHFAQLFKSSKKIPAVWRLSENVFLVAEHIWRRLSHLEHKEEERDFAILRIAAKLLSETHRANYLLKNFASELEEYKVAETEFEIESQLDFSAWKTALGTEIERIQAPVPKFLPPASFPSSSSSFSVLPAAAPAAAAVARKSPPRPLSSPPPLFRRSSPRTPHKFR